ncbi:MAG: hypothetical protein ACRERR_08450 [Moraxellaceae bacterium]
MPSSQRSILMIGESNVGKSHYGAQFLKRLIVGDCALRMDGAATNLKPFEAAMDSLAEGMAIGHTAASTYVESIWPIIDNLGASANLIWPDYGGEQVRNLIAERRVPTPWRDRILSATDWVLLIRLHTMRTADDIFSRPIAALSEGGAEDAQHHVSDQVRLIELLQMLLYIAGLDRDVPRDTPSLTVLLTCWDELGVQGTPLEILQEQLPMFSAFIDSTWREPKIVGLSALEKPLSQTDPDNEYAIHGPEQFGFIVLPDGTHSDDITLPIQHLLANQNGV